MAIDPTQEALQGTVPSWVWTSGVANAGTPSKVLDEFWVEVKSQAPVTSWTLTQPLTQWQAQAAAEVAKKAAEAQAAAAKLKSEQDAKAKEQVVTSATESENKVTSPVDTSAQWQLDAANLNAQKIWQMEIQNLQDQQSQVQQWLEQTKSSLETEWKQVAAVYDKEIALAEAEKARLKEQADKTKIEEQMKAKYDIDREEALKIKEYKDKLLTANYDEQLAIANRMVMEQQKASQRRLASVQALSNSFSLWGTTWALLASEADQQNVLYEREVEAKRAWVIQTYMAETTKNYDTYNTMMSRLKTAQEEAVTTTYNGLLDKIAKIQADENKTEREKLVEQQKIAKEYRTEIATAKSDIRNIQSKMFDSLQETNNNLIKSAEKKVEQIEKQKAAVNKWVNDLYDSILGTWQWFQRAKVMADIQRGIDNGTYNTVEEWLVDAYNAIISSATYKAMQANGTLPQNVAAAKSAWEVRKIELDEQKAKLDQQLTLSQIAENNAQAAKARSGGGTWSSSWVYGISGAGIWAGTWTEWWATVGKDGTISVWWFTFKDLWGWSVEWNAEFDSYLNAADYKDSAWNIDYKKIASQLSTWDKNVQATMNTLRAYRAAQIEASKKSASMTPVVEDKQWFDILWKSQPYIDVTWKVLQEQITNVKDSEFVNKFFPWVKSVIEKTESFIWWDKKAKEVLSKYKDKSSMIDAALKLQLKTKRTDQENYELWVLTNALK